MKLRILIILLLLFLFSIFSIVVGYYNWSFGLSTFAVKGIFDNAPVIKTSLIFLFTCLLNLLVAFFCSKENYKNYRDDVMVFSLMTPFLVIFVFLPGEPTDSIFLQLHVNVLTIFIITSQFISARLLQDMFWIIGGRRLI